MSLTYVTVFLLKAYIAAYKFDIVSISGTYHDSSIRHTTLATEISENNLIRSEQPSNSRCDGVCIYYKGALPLRVLNIHYLQESISFELKKGDKLYNFISLHRSLSQKNDEFGKFLRITKEI